MSRTLVKQAIFMTFHDEVLKRQNLDITIKELCQLCDINRNTFYYHFVSLDYMILWGFRKRLSKMLEARFDKESLVYDSESALDDDWKLAFYVDRRNPDDDLTLTDFWRTFDECLLGDSEYYRIVFKCQSGAFLPRKYANAHLMNYLFSIYYKQLYLDIKYANLRNPDIVLEDKEVTMLAMWFTNADIGLFVNRVNDIYGDGMPTPLSMSVFDLRRFSNMAPDMMKLLFSDDSFLNRQGKIDEQADTSVHPVRRR